MGVMKLPRAETVALSWNLGVSSAAMVALGYPGEIQDDPQGRWIWWAMAMIPFCYVVFTLVGGLSAATDKKPRVSEGSRGRGPIPDRNLMAHLSFRVHRQDARPRRPRCYHVRAGRVLDRRCRRQGCVWRSHLGHWGGEVCGGGRVSPGLIPK